MKATRVRDLLRTTAAALFLAGCGQGTPSPGSPSPLRLTPLPARELVAPRPNCAGTVLPVLTAAGGHAPYVELELAGQAGLFLIDYAASQSVLEQGVWQLPAKPGDRWSTLRAADGSTIDLVSMGPHTIPGWVGLPMLNFQIEDRDSEVAGHGPQIGVIAVGDLLFNQSVEFHFEDPGEQHVFISDWGAQCPASDLAAAGLERIDQTGHWAQGPQAPNGVFNGPVVYVSFEPRSGEGSPIGRTFAQFDTGLDDAVWDRTIIINRPLLDLLKSSAQPPRLQDTSLIRDCKGDARTQEVYSYAARRLRIENEDGKVIRRVAKFTLIFQDAAGECGGISAHPQPAAQMGASFLREFGTAVFLGQRNEVWVSGSGE